MNLRLLAVLVLCFSTTALAQGGKPAESPAPPPAQSSGASEDFVIGLEDILTVSVWKEPELSAKVVVRPDGKISLPLVNDITASGLTTRELQAQIADRLKEFIAAPNVSVS